MLKGFFIIGLVCSPIFECMEFMETKPIKYRTEKQCLREAEKLKDKMIIRFNNLGIPTTVEVQCKESKKWLA